MSLVSGLSGKGYHIYTDNFYTSPELFLDLYNNQFEACGTVRSNRKGITKEFQSKSMSKGKKYNIIIILHLPLSLGEIYSETIFGDKIRCLKWSDKRVVNMLSTFHGEDVIEKNKDKSGRWWNRGDQEASNDRRV